MTSPTTAAGRTGDLEAGSTARRATTETRASFKTTEFFTYLAAVVAVVITTSVVSGDGNTADPFNAEQALRCIIFLMIGYMIIRGLQKPVVASRALRTVNRSR